MTNAGQINQGNDMRMPSAVLAASVAIFGALSLSACNCAGPGVGLGDSGVLPDTSACAAGQLACQSGCVEPSVDPMNCGGCGVVCQGGCEGGSCVCPAGSSRCANACIPTLGDPDNCGGCGVQCGAGGFCDGGSCACPAGSSFCANSCVPTVSDPDNCGGCGVRCPGGQACRSGVCACPAYQSFCDGGCVPSTVDPDNCGGCGVRCTGAQACSAGRCEGSCLPGLTICANRCVDLKVSNQHCNACDAPCAAGTGCSDGQCVPTVPVGPAPASCSAGGAPLFVDAGNGGVCTGALAQTTFRWALCSCGDITLGGQLFSDAFDSLQGPYTDAGLGGGIGLNGAFAASSTNAIWGALWASSDGGVTTGSTNDVKQQLHVGGPVSSGGGFTVGDDAYVVGDVSASASLNVAKVLHMRPGATISGNVTYGSLLREPVVVPPPCACGPGEIIPVGAIVAAHQSPANDNALIGLDAGALATPRGAPVRLELPCGNYYLTGIDNGPDPVTVVATGRTALFIDGNATGAPITFTLTPGAEFDVFLTGVVSPWPGAKFNFGSPNYPALARIYSGGTAPTLLTGGAFAGNFYAARSQVSASSKLLAYGAIYAGGFSNSSGTTLHYDRQVLAASSSCPVPTSDAGSPTCASCTDCGNQACVGGQCGACTSSSQCCAPLICSQGRCQAGIN